MTEDFCWFLTGFTDGEGCFSIHKRFDEPGCRCKYSIKLRADDHELLSEIQRSLGHGKIYFGQRKNHDNANPHASLEISTKEGCKMLVDLFDKYPLRSKKANDFYIWKEAVALWLEHKQGDDWSEMIALSEELKHSRRYRTTQG